MVTAATTEYGATEKVMAAEEYLAVAEKNENNATKNESYYQILEQAWERDGCE